MKRAIAFIVVLAVLTAIGSYYQVRLIPYIVFGAVCVVSILIALGKINERYYPMYIYGLALALLWQTSMLGPWLVGVDIHNEYGLAQYSIANGWVTSYANGNNSSILVGAIIPSLAKLGFPLVWQFKVLYPAIYACTPLLLFFIYRKMIKERHAYFAVLFLMTVPMFSMEMTSMAKSLVSQTFLVAALWILFNSKARESWKMVMIVCTVGSAIACHYTVGAVVVIYLIGALVVLIMFRKWLGQSKMRLRNITITFTVCILLFVGYYGWIGGGFMLRTIEVTGRNLLHINVDVIQGNSTAKDVLARTRGFEDVDRYILGLNDPPRSEPIAETPTEEIPTVEIEEVFVEEVPVEEIPVEEMSIEPTSSTLYLENQEPLVRTAVGMDWTTASMWGKVFRILQYLSQILLVLGFFCMFRRRYSFPVEYKALVMACFGMLACCVFIPFFSTLASVTRFYQLALIFIAPMLIIGLEGIHNLVVRPK